MLTTSCLVTAGGTEEDEDACELGDLEAPPLIAARERGTIRPGADARPTSSRRLTLLEVASDRAEVRYRHTLAWLPLQDQWTVTGFPRVFETVSDGRAPTHQALGRHAA